MLLMKKRIKKASYKSTLQWIKSGYYFRGKLLYGQEAMSAGGKDSEAAAFDFSITVVSLVLG